MNVSVLQMFKSNLNNSNRCRRSTHIVDVLVRLETSCERRKNMTANQINYQNLQELKRHNVSTEFEAVRSNVAREIENNRHNVVGEVETNRHNVAGEYETNRHNVTWEQETSLHNRITEQETGRHNRATEGIGYSQVRLGYSQLAELARHNQETEGLQSDYQLYDYNMRNRENLVKQDQVSVSRANAKTQAKEAETHKYDANTRRYDMIWDGIINSLDLVRKGAKDTADLVGPLLTKGIKSVPKIK